MKISVMKLGGSEVANSCFLESLGTSILDAAHSHVVVHGGGPEVTAQQRVMGQEPTYLDGLRVTDSATLAIAEMVLAGTVNKRIVRGFNQAGLATLGLCGSDMGLLRAEKADRSDGLDLGYVGRIQTVNSDYLHALLAADITPVIAPIAWGGGQLTYNVNADDAALAIARALGAERLIYQTRTGAVLDGKQKLSELSANQAEAAIADGRIQDGMIPKVRAAFSALASGIPEVHIGTTRLLPTSNENPNPGDYGLAAPWSNRDLREVGS